MARFAVRLMVENDKPVERPHWVAKNARKAHNFRSYVGPKFQITDEPEQAMTVALASNAADWAERLSLTVGDRVVYRYEAVEAPTDPAKEN